MYVGPSEPTLFTWVLERAKLPSSLPLKRKQLTGIENHTDSKLYFWRLNTQYPQENILELSKPSLLSHNGIVSTFPLCLFYKEEHWPEEKVKSEKTKQGVFLQSSLCTPDSETISFAFQQSALEGQAIFDRT